MRLISIQFKEGELTPPCIVYFIRNDGIPYSVTINSVNDTYSSFKLNLVRGFKGKPSELAQYIMTKFKFINNNNAFQIIDPVSPTFIKEILRLGGNVVKISFTSDKKRNAFMKKLEKMKQKENTPEAKLKKTISQCVVNYYKKIFGKNFNSVRSIIVQYGRQHYKTEFDSMHFLVKFYKNKYPKASIKDLCYAISEFANLSIELNPFWEKQLFIYQLRKHREDLEDNISVIRGDNFFRDLLFEDTKQLSYNKEIVTNKINDMFNKIYGNKKEKEI